MQRRPLPPPTRLPRALRLAWLAALLLVVGCRSVVQGAAPNGPDQLRARGVLVVAVRDGAPPFGWRRPLDGRPEGLDVDLAESLARTLIGSDARVRLVPPAAAKEADLVMGVPASTATTRPYYRGQLALLVKRRRRPVRLAELDGQVVAVVRGMPLRTDLLAAARRVGVRVVPEFYDSYLLGLAAVGDGRAVALAGEAAVLRTLAAMDPNVRVVAAGWGETTYAIGGRRGLIPAADAALSRQMADTVAWSRLLRRWRLGARGGDIPGFPSPREHITRAFPFLGAKRQEGVKRVRFGFHPHGHQVVKVVN